MSWSLAAVAAVAGLVAYAGTAVVRTVLLRHGVLDRPNERSSHLSATPRGAGIAVVAAVPLALLLFDEEAPWPVLIAALALAAVSWVDDLRGLPPLPRLAAQAAAVAAVIAVAPWDGLVFQGWLPETADRIASGLLLLYFVNLFNFMDGIDGIAGVETACIGIGLAAVGAATFGVDALAVALAAAALGFLPWNWHPARIFLGDVGSVPLGFLLGWLLLGTAAAGQWAAALILPGYYLADASLTLASRALRGEPVWRAHRRHLYQRAALGRLGHAGVSRAVAASGAALVIAAAASTAGGVWRVVGLAGGAVLVAGLLCYLRRASATPGLHAD